MTFAPFPRENQNEPSASCPLVIYTIDLRTHEISTIPGSQGLWSPRWSPDGKKIVADQYYGRSDDLRDHLSELVGTDQAVPWKPCRVPAVVEEWEVGLLHDLGNSTRRIQLRIEDPKIERVADLSGIRTTGMAVVDPDGRLLILRDVSLNEIYALDMDLP
jgi:Tol biopolymer transport system component